MATIIYGPAYSNYARAVRLVFEEKGAPYELVEVDQFGGEHKGPAHLKRHPFGLVPAFEHDGFELYETDAIMRYVDRVFPGVRLTPADPKAEARMNQIMGITDAYADPVLIRQIVVQRVVAPLFGRAADEAAIAAALPKAETVLGAVENLMQGGGPCLLGASPTLADLLLAPVVHYFVATPEGAGMLPRYPALEGWWKAIEQRPSMLKTKPQPLKAPGTA